MPYLFGAPWAPTEIDKVRKMLSLAKVKPGDIVYDLGSGDGRIIMTAAREFHASSIGIEVNPLWVLWTRLKIEIVRLTDHVEVVWGNFFQKDLSKADVVTLYLLQGMNNRLKQKLERELKPGTRIVSYVFTFPDWELLDYDCKSEIYVYRIGDNNV